MGTGDILRRDLRQRDASQHVKQDPDAFLGGKRVDPAEVLGEGPAGDPHPIPDLEVFILPVETSLVASRLEGVDERGRQGRQPADRLHEPRDTPRGADGADVCGPPGGAHEEITREERRAPHLKSRPAAGLLQQRHECLKSPPTQVTLSYAKCVRLQLG